MSSSSSAARKADRLMEFSAWSLADLRAPQVVEQEEAEVVDEQLALQQAEEAARVLAEQDAAEEERRIEEAYQRGMEDGRRQGEIGEAARLRSAVLAAQNALEELRDGEMKWSGSIEDNVCALAVTIARQVIGRELTVDNDMVLELVQTAIAEFPIDQPLRIRLNPSDFAVISGVDQDAEIGVAALAGDRDARWISDAGVAPGGCLIEGRDRIIDGRVDTGLERIYRRLTYTHA